MWGKLVVDTLLYGRKATLKDVLRWPFFKYVESYCGMYYYVHFCKTHLHEDILSVYDHCGCAQRIGAKQPGPQSRSMTRSFVRPMIVFENKRSFLLRVIAKFSTFLCCAWCAKRPFFVLTLT